MATSRVLRRKLARCARITRATTQERGFVIYPTTQRCLACGQRETDYASKLFNRLIHLRNYSITMFAGKICGQCLFRATRPQDVQCCCCDYAVVRYCVVSRDTQTPVWMPICETCEATIKPVCFSIDNLVQEDAITDSESEAEEESNSSGDEASMAFPATLVGRVVLTRDIEHLGMRRITALRDTPLQAMMGFRLLTAIVRALSDGRQLVSPPPQQRVPTPPPEVKQRDAPAAQGHDTCVVCLENAPGTVRLAPCGETRLCYTCAWRLFHMTGDPSCPMCRKTITSIDTIAPPPLSMGESTDRSAS